MVGGLKHRVLILALLVGIMLGGYAPEAVMADAKQMEQAPSRVERLFADEFLRLMEKSTYDKAFDKSRNATVTFWREVCLCGGERWHYKQSYTDASLGASAVRECPLDEARLDNLVTERYAVSTLCTTCQEAEIVFDSDEIWLFRGRFAQPHYHLEQEMASDYYWCKIYTDGYDRKKGGVYRIEGSTVASETVLEIKEGSAALPILCQYILEHGDKL